MRRFIGLLIVGALLSLGQVASAGPYEDGYAAYERQDYATALKFWRPLAERGDARPQYNLGKMYFNGQGVAQDRTEAVKWYRRAAEQGLADAQWLIGMMYSYAQDYKEAVKWYRLAAEQGYAAAQGDLGQLYRMGYGVPQDYKEAVKWYRLAAEQGNAGSQYQLGVMYTSVQGVPLDYEEAVKWYRLAAGQGLEPAQNTLGRWYRDGQGVAQNYKEAVKWYRLAAEQGNVDAQDNLGVMYEEGQGVPQDYVRAHMWLNLAAVPLSGEHAKRVTDSRTRIASKMTPPQIAQAQAMARTCQQSKFKDCGDPESKPVPSSPAPPQTASRDTSPPIRSSATSVPMTQQGGTFVVPVLINNAINLNFVVDSGAADVSIPTDVVAVMMRTGTLTEKDFGTKKTYVLADGSKVESRTFRIRSLKVGDRVVENVIGSEAHIAGDPLLGQSFLQKFKSWSIDNSKHALVLE